MNPNQPQSPPPNIPNPSSADYLNQIAPKTSRLPRFQLGPKLFLMIGGVLVLLVIILSISVNSIAAGQRRPLEKLAARLQSTETVVKDAQVNLKSSQLRSLNSELKLFMADTNRDLADPLKLAGVDVKKLSATAVKNESTTELTDRLEDARLNAIYDRTYAREMAYRLDTIITLMEQIYDSTSSTSLKTFLETTYKKLEPTQKTFSDFNASNG
ncbi:MAG: hypothetical protein WAO28_03135 [Candidatus Microsaccharimonas sp.]